MSISGPSLASQLFDANWREPPSMVSEWSTQIDKNMDASEQRRGLRGKPRRTARSGHLNLSATDAAGLLFLLKEQTDTRLYYPLYQDQSVLTASASIGAGVVQCETSNRRFFAGSDVLIIEWDKNKKASKVEKHTLNQVLSSSLDLVGTLANDFSGHACVYPCIIADINLQQQGSVANDSVFELEVKVSEYTSTSTLPSVTTPGALPVGSSSYKGIPVLDLPHRWQTTTEGVGREGKQSEVGLGTLYELYGSDSYFTAQLDFMGKDRESSFNILRFFESRGGANYSFWYPMQTRAALLVTKTAATVTLSGSLPGSAYANSILAFVLKDGSVKIRFVIGVASLGSNAVLTLNENLTEAASDIERVSFATLARFASDSFSERWLNLNVMETTLPILGLPWSGDISCSGDGCEQGGCSDPEDCDDPTEPPEPDPPDQPWTPGGACELGTATVPTYYDLHETWNSGREPIRAADLTLPDTVTVTVKSSMSVDSNHPEAPVSLSPELEAVLYESHELTYAGTLSRSLEKSRNPYHYRVVSGTPSTYGVRSGGENIENSPYWEKVIDYKINEGEIGEEDHTLTLRMYAEYVDQGSGIGDTGYGAWGTMYVVWAWSSEHDSYTDGTPYASFDDIEFTKTDPFVGGLYEGETSANKYAHPSALFVAMTPTTWHYPLGFSFHSMLTREQYLHSCYAAQPGAPWSDGGADDAILNSVFGDGNFRALGSLGGWTKSEFFNWLCVENTQGTGVTILKPSRPGWLENTAELTPGSADVTIDVCTPDQTQNRINPSEGYPTNPCQNVGGTHECWRNNSAVGQSSWISVGCTESTRVRVVEQCVTDKTTYDVNCNPVDSECDASPVTTVFTGVVVDDYTYNFGGPQSGRLINFKKYVDNPDYVRQSWPQVECDFAGSYWDSDVGSGTDDATDCESEPAGSASLSPTSGKIVNLCYSFDPPSATSPEDGSVSFKVTPSASDKIGIGFRMTVVGGSVATGYISILDMTTDKLWIYVVSGSDSISALGSVDVQDGIPADTELTLKKTTLGEKHTFTLSVGEETIASISRTDCTYTSGGQPAVCSLSDGSFDVSDLSVFDNSWQKLEISGNITGLDTITSSADSDLCKGHTQGNCEGCEPEDCPGDDPLGPECNGPCTSICKNIVGVYTVASSGYPGGVTKPGGLSWHPPTDVGPCDEEGCDPPLASCGDCPEPWEAYEWDFSGDCGSSTNPAANESIWTGGLSAFNWDIIVCD